MYVRSKYRVTSCYSVYRCLLDRTCGVGGVINSLVRDTILPVVGQSQASSLLEACGAITKEVSCTSHLLEAYGVDDHEGQEDQ